ncbi:ParB N-terminal domain-containing protein [Bacillus sp. SCS-151]|uniref:ParB N-terminal domain-containing protein n=1 Tax=Nanhaiella sioensis TaxID=3115293 RepID=UPI00397AA29A
MLINVNEINVNDRIRKDFGNIEELAQDIKENGLINPPVVTPDYQLIAGERRLRACKHLGYEQIEVRVMSVKDYEHQLKLEISENENRKEFTFSERVDWARRLERIEKENAKKRQATSSGGCSPQLMENFPHAAGATRDIVAEVSGFGSGKQFEKAKYVSENADLDTIQKIDDGEISIHKAYTELKNKLSDIEKELEIEKNKPPKIQTRVIEKEVDRTDYKSIEILNNQIKSKQKSYDLLLNEKNALEKKMKLTEQENKEFAQLKNQIKTLMREKEDVGRQIQAATSISGLVVEIDHLIKEKLAPIQYSQALQEMQNDEIVIENLTTIIDTVQSWCNEMKKYLPNTRKIIDMEVV